MPRTTRGGAVAGGLPSVPRFVTIHECVYPDDRRRAAGEGDEAVSRVFFSSLENAQQFRARQGGEIRSYPVSVSKKKRMEALGLLPKPRVGAPRGTFNGVRGPGRRKL